MNGIYKDHSHGLVVTVNRWGLIQRFELRHMGFLVVGRGVCAPTSLRLDQCNLRAFLHVQLAQNHGEFFWCEAALYNCLEYEQ